MCYQCVILWKFVRLTAVQGTPGADLPRASKPQRARGRLESLRHEISEGANSVENFNDLAFGLGRACGNLCDFVRTNFRRPWPPWLVASDWWLAIQRLGTLRDGVGVLFLTASDRHRATPFPCGWGPCGVVGVSFESRSLRAEARTCCDRSF
jgi:hypothetical protein